MSSKRAHRWVATNDAAIQATGSDVIHAARWDFCRRMTPARRSQRLIRFTLAIPASGSHAIRALQYRQIEIADACARRRAGRNRRTPEKVLLIQMEAEADAPERARKVPEA